MAENLKQIRDLKNIEISQIYKVMNVKANARLGY